MMLKRLKRENPVLKAQITQIESLRAVGLLFSAVYEFTFVAVVCTQFVTQAALGACLLPLAIIGESFDIINPKILN